MCVCVTETSVCLKLTRSMTDLGRKTCILVNATGKIAIIKILNVH
jgi:hypothetical protein